MLSAAPYGARARRRRPRRPSKPSKRRSRVSRTFSRAGRVRREKSRLAPAWTFETARCSFAERSPWPSRRRSCSAGDGATCTCCSRGRGGHGALVPRPVALWPVSRQQFGRGSPRCWPSCFRSSRCTFSRPSFPRRDGHQLVACFASPVSLAVPMLLLTLSPQHKSSIVRVAIFRLRVRSARRRAVVARHSWSKERLARDQAQRELSGGHRRARRQLQPRRFPVVHRRRAAAGGRGAFDRLPLSCWPSRCAASACSISTRWSAGSWSRPRSRFSWPGIFCVFVTYLGRFNTIYLNADPLGDRHPGSLRAASSLGGEPDPRRSSSASVSTCTPRSPTRVARWCTCWRPTSSGKWCSPRSSDRAMQRRRRCTCSTREAALSISPPDSVPRCRCASSWRPRSRFSITPLRAR